MSIQLQQVEQVLAAAGLADRLLVTQQQSTGNIQISIKNLGSVNHIDVCGILYKTGVTLLESGLPGITRKNVVQLSHPTGEKDSRGADIWKPWPCSWVNQPDPATQRVAQLEHLIAQQTAMMQQLQGNQPQQATTVPMNQASQVAPTVPFSNQPVQISNQMPQQVVTTVPAQELTIENLPGAVVTNDKGTPVF